MNIIKKFTLAMFTSRVHIEIIEPDILKFADGSIRVSLPKIDEIMEVDDSQGTTICAFIESMDDLMIVAQIKDIVQRKFNVAQVNINILGTPYTRYDRVMFDDQSDAFGLRCFAQLLNSIEFNEVRIYDPHSYVTTKLIKNCVQISQSELVRVTVGSRNLCRFDIVCPDAGARSKLDDKFISILCDKTRNPLTGKIEGVKVVYDNSSGTKPLLVIDDICEGGRTFLGVADAIGETDISLYITHGIFSNNAIPKLLEKYSHIYVYMMKESVYNDLTETDKSKVSVANLIQA